MQNDHHKIIVLEYLERGERKEAIDYLMQTYDGVDSSEAEKLIQVIEQEAAQDQSGSTNSGCAGCFAVLLKLVSVFFILVSITLFSVAGFFYYTIKNERLELVKVEAEVIELVQTAEEEQVYLKLEYDWEGKTYTDQTNIPVAADEYVVHERLLVSINPHYPGQAYLLSETDVDFLELIEGDNLDEINDQNIVSFFNEIVVYFAVVPGIFLFFLGIVLWVVSNRITQKK